MVARWSSFVKEEIDPELRREILYHDFAMKDDRLSFLKYHLAWFRFCAFRNEGWHAKNTQLRKVHWLFACNCLNSAYYNKAAANVLSSLLLKLNFVNYLAANITVKESEKLWKLVETFSTNFTGLLFSWFTQQSFHFVGFQQ